MFGKGYLKTSLLAIAVCGLSWVGMAYPFTWTGAAGDGKWSTKENWTVYGQSANTPPESGDEAILTDTTSGTDGNTIEVDEDVTISKLTFKGSQSYTLTSAAGKKITSSGSWYVGADSKEVSLTVSIPCAIGGNLYVGCDESLPGVLYVTDGANISATKVQIGGKAWNASNCRGWVYQSGGTVTATAGDNESFKLAFAGSGSTGYYELTGGTLVIPAFGSVMSGSTGTFLLDGGTIKVNAKLSKFWENYNGYRIHLKIGVNGGTFDTNGYDINLNSYAIESALTEGTDGGLTKTGVGTLTLGAAYTFSGTLKVKWGTVVDADGAVHAREAFDERHVITIGDTERSYALYVPAKGTENIPLVISLHGAGGTIYKASDGVYTPNARTPFRTATADDAGCIVVYPQGLWQNFNVLGSQNYGWWSDGSDTTDVTFFKAIIEEVAKSYPIDRKRVYLCGFSNGGMMTYAATTLASDTFAAFASISGYQLNEFHLRATGARPVPFLHIHGKNDDFVKYSLWPTIRDMMVARNGCNTIPTVTTVEGGYTKSVYAAGEGGFPYVSYEVDGMGHGDYTDHTEDGNSSTTIWNFLKGYTLGDACDATLKWRETPDATGWTAADHGWTVSADGTTYVYGTNKAGGSQNVYPALQLEANGSSDFYSLRVRTSGTAGDTVTATLVDVDYGTELATATCTVGTETSFKVTTDSYRQCKLTLVKSNAADKIDEITVTAGTAAELSSDNLTRWIGEDGADAATAANWEEVAGAEKQCLINSDNAAVLGAGKALTVNKTMYVGRGYGQKSDGTWGLSASYDHPSTLTVSGGDLTVNARLWIGGGYSDYYDSILNVSSGAVTVNELYTGDCASNSDKQDHKKTCLINVTGGSLTTTGNFKLGDYSGSTNAVNLTGGTLTVGGELTIGQAGKANVTLDGTGATFNGTTLVGASSWRGNGTGVLTVLQGQKFSRLLVGTGSGTGILNINRGVTESYYNAYPGSFAVGNDSGSHGYVNIAEDAALCVTQDWIYAGVNIGNGSAAYGEINNAGTLETLKDINIGNGDSSTGIVYTTGTFATPASLNIGNNDGTYGEFTIEGGRTEIGYGVNVGSHSNSTARLYVKGGELVYTATGQWSGDMKFGGKENGDAYVEVTGGCISNASAHAIVINSYPTDSSSGTMVVDGGTVYSAGSIRVGDSYSGMLTIRSGLVEADGEINLGAWNQDESAVDTVNFLGGTVFMKRMTCTYAKSTKNITINGTTFKAKDDATDFFCNCGTLTPGEKGMIVDTDGHAVTIQNKIMGVLAIKPSDGLLTLTNQGWDTGANSGCVLAPAVDAEGTYTIKVEATHSEAKATFSADGVYTFAWVDKGDNTYEVAATRAKILKATWINGAGDGDIANPANWTCVNALGFSASAIPTADTDVYIPAGLSVDVSGLTVKSVTMLAATAGTTYLRGDCTVPDVVKTAIAWYDPDDASTVTKDDDGNVAAMSNKGTAGATLDLVASKTDSRPGMDETKFINGRGTLTFDNANFGLVSTDGVELGTDSDVALFAVSERSSTGSKQIFDIELCSGADWEEAGLMGIAQWPWYGGRLMVNANTNSEGVATTLVMADMYNDAETLYIWGEQVGATSASGFCVRKDGEEFQVKNSSGLTYEYGRTGVKNSSKLHYVAYGTRRENPCGSTGRLAESFIFNKALTEEEVAAIQQYLETKWFTPFDPSSVLPDFLLENGAVVDFGGGDWLFNTLGGKGSITSANVTVTGALKLVLDDEGNLSAGIACDGTFTMDDGATISASEEAFDAVRAALIATKAPITVVTAKSVRLPGDAKKILVKDASGRTFQLVKKGNTLVFEIQPSFTIHVR